MYSKIKKCAQLIKKYNVNLRKKDFQAQNKYIQYYEALPLDEHMILLEATHGIKIDGNMYYIAKFLSQSEQYKDYRVYVSSTARAKNAVKNKLTARGLDNIHIVEHDTFEYYKLLATAKYIFIDTSMNVRFIKKEGQHIFNTWHGTPLKHLGRQNSSEYDVLGNVQRSFAMSDYILFPNRFTQECIIRDYMLENMSSGSSVMCGYPRNEPFFDTQLQMQIREEYDLADKKVYAFMPTFRGVSAGSNSKIGNKKNDTYLNYYLYELDSKLQDNEVLYVNLHPLTKKSIDICCFEHIRAFPEKYETYEFLSIADCLITDYSSVFFDFACTGRKIVLFTYDLEEYLRDRGMYLDINGFPFPKVFNDEQLLTAIRSPKDYDDSDFLRTYCAYDGLHTTEKICDLFFFGRNSGMTVEKIQDNGRENVLLYAGDLSRNGITIALKNLLNSVDLGKRNYFLVYDINVIKTNRDNLLPTVGNISYIAKHGDINLTITGRILRKLYKLNILNASAYVGLLKKYMKYELKRQFGNMRIDTAVQFNGYGSETNLIWTLFDCNTAIFVHNDMEQEIRTKHNQRLDVLQYAYRNYDKVAIVSKDIKDATARIRGDDNAICVCHNVMDYQTILEKAQEEVDYASIKVCSQDEDVLMAMLHGQEPKFISIGRFSMEKNHELLVRAFKKIVENDQPDAKLLIVGGYNNQNYYEKTLAVAEELSLTSNIALIQNTPNSYAILKNCDYFVLSSLHEGLPLVLSEADILGKPLISTDIPGPRSFLEEHGGVLVENSIDGVYQGMRRLLNGEIQPMQIDFIKYNENALSEFEQIL